MARIFQYPERIIGLLSGLITIFGFIYSLNIQNYIDLRIPDLSIYSFFWRSIIWIICEGFFAIGFAILIVFLARILTRMFLEKSKLITIITPIFILSLFLSAWQTIIFAEHFFDTSNLEIPTRYFAASFRNIIALIYSIVILYLHDRTFEVDERLEKEEKDIKSDISFVGYFVVFWITVLFH
ncbi:signal transduction histidine kinase [Rhodobium orientis]|uniref:hypothetical protein n=1 Tax=Rhodobium orientis TaxID=34017 RepID=UPI0011B94407|nr:hypothetical protein [Rhodobium orientis]MBB4301768.1 signal transduction histidine kinase [Rhodobium orientis]